MTETSREIRTKRRPSWTGSAIAVGVAAGAISLVASNSAQLVPLVLAVSGLLALASDAPARASDLDPLGVGVVLAGTGLVLAAGYLAVHLPESMTAVAELVPSLVGLGLIGLGLSWVRLLPSRPLVTVGAACIASTALISGVVDETPALSVIVAVAATAIAWDAAEQAISLGEQVGRGTDSTGVELAHSGASAVVAAVAVATAAAVKAIGTTEVPLGGLVLLLGAAIVLLVALYR